MTLTEQWKKGELPTGDYYVKPKNGQVFVYHINHSVKHIYHNHAGEIKEVLAPVPSYEEWQHQQMSLRMTIDDYKNVVDICEQLKELLSKCLDELAEFNNSYYPETQKLFSQITNAIGEKK